MQISILIPVYNYDCSELLQAIGSELQEIKNLDYEILLGNDASSGRYKNIYLTYEQRYSQVSVLHFEQNMGASRLRNQLAEKARYPNLLFFDSDVLPNKGTIKKYLEAMAQYPTSLIYGGFYYDKQDLRADNHLRYRYGLELEVRSLAEREAKPYQSFITMAFALPKSLLLAYPFPDIGMGYEDALWGAILERNKIAIQHINAPVKHGLKETDEAFLQTLQKYVANLHKNEELFKEFNIPLLQTYLFLRDCHLLFLLSLLSFVEPLILRFLQANVCFVFFVKLLKLVYLYRDFEGL